MNLIGQLLLGCLTDLKGNEVAVLVNISSILLARAFPLLICWEYSISGLLFAHYSALSIQVAETCPYSDFLNLSVDRWHDNNKTILRYSLHPDVEF